MKVKKSDQRPSIWIGRGSPFFTFWEVAEMRLNWKAALRALSVGDLEKASMVMLDCWDECPPNELMTVQVDREDVKNLADMLDSACSFHDQPPTGTPEQQENLKWFKTFLDGLDGQNPNPCE